MTDPILVLGGAVPILRSGATAHGDLPGRSVADAHPTAAITGLDAALAARQPLSANLSAIAGLTTATDTLAYWSGVAQASVTALTGFGRSLIGANNAAAVLTLLGTAALYDPLGAASAAQSASQPVDADLTAIAALSTTSYGRSCLTLADAAAARTLFGAQVAGSYQPADATLSALASLGIGAANTVLVSNGSSPAWSTSLNLAGGIAAASDSSLIRSTTGNIGISIGDDTVGARWSWYFNDADGSLRWYSNAAGTDRLVLLPNGGATFAAGITCTTLTASGGIVSSGYTPASAGDPINVHVGPTGGVGYVQCLTGVGQSPLSVDASSISFRTNGWQTALTLAADRSATFTSSVTCASVSANGTVISTNGTGYSRLSPGGDVEANRGDGTGVYYFATGGTKYLYYTGSAFTLNGGALTVTSGGIYATALTAGNSALTTASGYNILALNGSPDLAASVGIYSLSSDTNLYLNAPSGRTVRARLNGADSLIVSGSTPGTPGGSEVLIGGGAIKAGGVIQAYDQFRVYLFKTPASASDTGTAGSFCYDQNYVYVCVNTNQWKRAALAAW